MLNDYLEGGTIGIQMANLATGHPLDQTNMASSVIVGQNSITSSDKGQLSKEAAVVRIAS